MPKYEFFEIPETRSPDQADVVLADLSDPNSRCFTHYAYAIGSSERQWGRLAERRGIDLSLLRNWSDFQARNADASEQLRRGETYWPGKSALCDQNIDSDTKCRNTALRLGALELLANLFSGRISATDKDPFPHQLALQQYMRAEQGRLQRVLIADEVGLGKTIEVGLVLRDILIARGSLEQFSCLYLTSGGLVEDACLKLRDVMRGSLDDQAIVETVNSFAKYGSGNTRGVHVASLHAARLYTTRSRKEKFLPHTKVAPEIVVIDECHHCACELDLISKAQIAGNDVTRSYQAAAQMIDGTFWLDSEKPKLIILMSATPFRSRIQFINLLKLLTHGATTTTGSSFQAYDPATTTATLSSELKRVDSPVCVVWRQQTDPGVERWSGGRLFPNLSVVRPHKVDDGTPRLGAASAEYLSRMNIIVRTVIKVSRANGAAFAGFAVAQLEKKLTSSSLAGACWIFSWCVRHCEWGTLKDFESDATPGAENLRRLIVEISQKLASFARSSTRHADVVFASEGFTFPAVSLSRAGKVADIYRFSSLLRSPEKIDSAPFVAAAIEIAELAQCGIDLLRPNRDGTQGKSAEGTGDDPSSFGVENVKLNWLESMLAHYPHERFLVFTESLQTCAIITSAIPRSDQLVGSMALESRNDVVGRFRSGSIRVLVATSAADEGLDLQVANRVVHWDLSTSPAVLMQRNGRVARLGQISDVTAYYLITSGTHEERRDEALAKRFTELGIDDESLRLKILGVLDPDEEDRLALAVEGRAENAVGDILAEARRDSDEMEKQLGELRTRLQWHYVLDREALATRLERWHRLGLPEHIQTEFAFSERTWSRPIFGDVATSVPATAKVATLEKGGVKQRVVFDPEYQVFAGASARGTSLAGLRPWTRRQDPRAGTTKLRPDPGVDLLGDLSGALARLRHADFSMLPTSSLTNIARLSGARWLLFATHPMREAENDLGDGQARYLTCYPFNEDLSNAMLPDGLSAEEVDRLIQALEEEALRPEMSLDEISRNEAVDVGIQLGQWLSVKRQLGGHGFLSSAEYFLPVPVALVRLVSQGDRPSLAGEARNLAISSDGIDKIGSNLLRACLQAEHVTLADAIAAAEAESLPPLDGYLALQRLTRRGKGNLVRHFVEHSEAGTRAVSSEYVSLKLFALRGSREDANRWMSTVEVIWTAVSRVRHGGDEG